MTPVDLFTGSDVPKALQPKDVIPAAGGGPYSSKVKLGRVINGPTRREPKYVFSACYLTKSVDIHAMSMACADFVEGSFIQCEEGHYQAKVRLPFRNQSLALPSNRYQAGRRALSLKLNSSRTPYSKKIMLHLSKT